jgi:transcription antitermination factor NusG
MAQNPEVARVDYFMPGEKVRVVRGPLQNVEGTLFMQKNNHRLVVRVESIKQAIAVEINPLHVERIGAGGVVH